MKALNGFNNVEASTGSFESLPAGGYVAKILKVVNHNEEKPFLEVVFDIAEGEYAGYFNSDFGTKNEWAHSFRSYYSEAALGMFKGFIESIDKSNKTNFSESIEKGFNEQSLVGKLVGIIVGYEEYKTNRGEIGQRMRVKGTRSADTIRQNKFRVPELKKLEASIETTAATPTGFTPLKDEDCPF